MGELSQTIGKKLENFGNTLFANLGWEMLAQDLPIDCTRSTHKSPTAKSGEKRTHGIDILQSFYNPFSARKTLLRLLFNSLRRATAAKVSASIIAGMAPGILMAASLILWLLRRPKSSVTIRLKI